MFNSSGVFVWCLGSVHACMGCCVCVWGGVHSPMQKNAETRGWHQDFFLLLLFPLVFETVSRWTQVRLELLDYSGFATCPQYWGYWCVLPCLAFRRLMMVCTPPHVCLSSPLPTESSTVSQTFYSVIRTKPGQVAFESHYCLSSPQQLSICLSLFLMTLTYLKHAAQVCVENVAGWGFPSVFFWWCFLIESCWPSTWLAAGDMSVDPLAKVASLWFPTVKLPYLSFYAIPRTHNLIQNTKKENTS